MTKSERAHISRAVSLGCSLCRYLGLGESPAEAHHPRTGTGAGRRASHFDVIGLCPYHHRNSNEALHAMGRKAFERHFGVTELDLLAKTRALLGEVECAC